MTDLADYVRFKALKDLQFVDIALIWALAGMVLLKRNGDSRSLIIRAGLHLQGY